MRIKVLGILFALILFIVGTTAQATEAHSTGMDPAEANYRLFLEEIGLTTSESDDASSDTTNISEHATPELGDSSLDSTFLIAVASLGLCGSAYVHRKRVRI